MDDLRLALPEGFSYIHEPFLGDGGPIPMLGHEGLVEQLADRLRHSDGGTFLVTGFRGVGKTTVVQRAVDGLRQRAERENTYVVVRLNVARPTAANELLFSMVRTLFEGLVESRVFDGLPAPVQHNLLLAYTRTSLQLAHTRTDSRDLHGGLGTPSGVLPTVLGSLLPKFELGLKTSRSLATEASFLAYGESDVEHDFLRIVRALKNVHSTGPTDPRRRWLPFRSNRNPATGRPVKVVVVVDELDKLTASPAGRASFEDLLVGMKNVFTSAGAHFVLVCGADVHDLVATDTRRGSGIYESVFSWHTYVPCLWSAPALLVDRLVGDGGSGAAKSAAGDLVGMLALTGRGTPRRLLQQFYALTSWTGDRAYVHLTERDRRRANLLASVNRLVDDFLGAAHHDQPTTLHEDRHRIAVAHTVDWVLASDGRVFEVADILAAGDPTVTDSGYLVLEASTVREVLRHLVDSQVLVAIGDQPTATLVGSSRSSDVEAFQLETSMVHDLRAIAGVSSDRLIVAGVDLQGAVDWASPGRHRDREEVPAPPSPTEAPWESPLGGSPSWLGTWPPGGAKFAQPAEPPLDWTTSTPGSSPPPPGAGVEVVQGPSDRQYSLERVIGTGAIGTVYEAKNLTDGSRVAIKLVERQSVLGDPDVRARLLREVMLAVPLRHPSIVRTIGAIEGGEAFGVVMELVDGTPLTSTTRPAPAGTAVRWGQQLADALQYLADRGIARIDLKPSNIVLRTDGHPVLVDLALAKRVGEPTDDAAGALANIDSVYMTMSTTVVVGTPAYMAPEQFGSDTIDIRADLYSLGLVLFELMGGVSPRSVADDLTALIAAAHEPLPLDSVNVSHELHGVLKTATAVRPDQRFDQPREMAAALAATPEAATGSG